MKLIDEFGYDNSGTLSNTSPPGNIIAFDAIDSQKSNP